MDSRTAAEVVTLGAFITGREVEAFRICSVCETSSKIAPELTNRRPSS